MLAAACSMLAKQLADKANKDRPAPSHCYTHMRQQRKPLAIPARGGPPRQTVKIESMRPAVASQLTNWHRVRSPPAAAGYLAMLQLEANCMC